MIYDLITKDQLENTKGGHSWHGLPVRKIGPKSLMSSVIMT